MMLNRINKLSPGAQIIVVIAIALAAYSTKIVLPSFNDDDIVQGQPVSHDYYSFLSQGRWGYYFIYRFVFDANPGGAFPLILGIAILAMASYFGANSIGLKHPLSRLVYMSLFTVSLYYGDAFSFDSTRVSYPLASLTAAAGVWAVANHKYWLAVLLFTISPALYQGGVGVACAIIVSAAILHIARQNWQSVPGASARAAALLLAGMLLYFLSTHACALITGIPLSGRSSINVLDALRAYDRIIVLFGGHSIPNGLQMPYFSPLMKAAIWTVGGSFAVVIALHRMPLAAKAACYALALLLSMAPYALAFASPQAFEPRALLGFSAVHAAFGAIAMELLLPGERKAILGTMTSATATFLMATSIQLSGSAFDEYQTSRNDILATNQIISRIDDAISKSNVKNPQSIPIMVKYGTPVTMSPRGPFATYRASAWSKEWIFRLIDPRFSPVDNATSLLLEPKAAALPTWPKQGSVAVLDGIVVVHIN